MLMEEFYEKINGDYNNIKGRLRNDILIEKFVKKFLNEKGYEELIIATDNKDIENSISAAHKLKGVAANLSFTTLYNSLTELLIQLRKEDVKDIDEVLLQNVKNDYNKIIGVIEEL